MIKEIRLFAFLLIILTSTQLASEEVILTTYSIPKYVKNEQEGSFILLTKLIEQHIDKKIMILVAPPKRAVKMFSSGEVDGYFPSLDVLNSKEVNKTIPFYIKHDFVFYHKDNPIENITKRSVCLTLGYPYSPLITQRDDVKFITLLSDQACFRQLSIGRVDALIVEEITGLRARALINAESVAYNRNAPVSAQNVYYAFQNNEKGKSLTQAFDNALKVIFENGSYKDIFAFSPPEILESNSH